MRKFGCENSARERERERGRGREREREREREIHATLYPYKSE